MSLLCTVQVFAQPDWSAPTFERNMSVRTSLIDACNSVGDIIGVFSKTTGEIRGVSDPITTTDTILITVFSESSTGEVMVYRFYDSESDSIFDIADVEFSFLNNSVLGLSDPIVVPGQESVPPVMMCKNKTVYLDENGEASIVVDDIDDGSTDNCVIASRVLSKMNFSCDDLGDNTVTLTITDTYNNSSSCDATVTVLDTISPTPSCLNPTIYINENGVATLSIAEADDESFDNCNTLIRELSQTSFDCVEKGSNNVALTIRDVSDNVDSCIALVTVLDTIKPIVNCNSVTIFLDANGAANITTGDINNNSTDNCTISSVVLDQTDFDCDELGSNMVTLTVRDDSDNVQSCMSTVTVRDTIKPVAICKPFTLVLDANGMATLDSDDIDNGSTDNCSIETMVLSKTDFDCTDIGMQSVTLTITDKAGNTDMCTTTVTIVDEMAPIVVCKDIEVELAEDGTATITAADVDDNSSDNCGIATRIISKSSFSKNEERVQSVTLTITDNVGLVSTCIARITIINNFENDILNCRDGVDNDNDGLTDCQDPDCMQPVVSGIKSTNPIPTSCTTTMSDGVISVTSMNGSMYSSDGGVTFQNMDEFSNLDVGTYQVVVLNDETGCSTLDEVIIENTFDPLSAISSFDVLGPDILCAGIKGVTYDIDLPSGMGSLEWAYDNGTIDAEVNGVNSKISFDASVTSGVLTATVNGICTSLDSQLPISIADASTCNLIDCIPEIFIDTEALNAENSPTVYRASSIITSNAFISNKAYEMSAGEEFIFFPGFEVGQGAAILMDISPCD